MIRLDQICTCEQPDVYVLGDLLSVTVCLICGGRCENRPSHSPRVSTQGTPPSPGRGRFSERLSSSELSERGQAGGSLRLPLGKTRRDGLRRLATDISQGRESTPEGELKNEASAHAYSCSRSESSEATVPDPLAELVREVGEAADRLERLCRHLNRAPRLEVVE